MIRPGGAKDLPVLGELGAMLVRAHHAFDPQRFLRAGPEAARHYGAFLGSQLRRRDAAVLVAERDGTVVGYVYVELEPRNWKELRDESGFIHDVVVAPDERRHGVATQLLAAATDRIVGRGAPRVVLWTAEHNDGARRLFEGAGFRPTMVEMTRELAVSADTPERKADTP